MLSFSTEFPVEEPNASAFCQSVAKWLSGSPHTAIEEDDVLAIFTSEESSWEQGSERISCILQDTDEGSAAAFRYSKSEDGVVWLTTVCFDSNSIDSWVSIRTERNSNTALAFLPSAKKPFVIRNLLTELGGGVDGELRIQDAPHHLTYSDANMAVRLMNGDAEHHLPFVYISMPFAGGHYIDAGALARHLCGVAHVLVEPSREFSREIQPYVFSQNPYGGYIGIAFPSGEWLRIDPLNYSSDFDVRKEIFERIRTSLLSRRQMSRCSWMNIRARSASKQRKKTETSSEIKDYAKAFDREIEAKDAQIAEAESEITRLTSELRQKRRNESVAKGGISLKISKEQELEAGEFREFVIDALSNYQAAVEENSRRDHVLLDLLNSNSRQNCMTNKRDKLKKALRGYRHLDAALRSKIEELGFSISEDGKHYRLTYRGDQRYHYTLAKSPSDNRAGINAATQMSRLFF